MDINKLVRSHLLNLKPYSSARDEFKGEADVYLDANENSYGSTSEDRFRRYPDPYQLALKAKISQIKGIGQDHIFIGNGSDEPIDLLIRAFCNPAKDSVIITPPTYGMYEVSASVNDVKVVKVPLKKDYSLDLKSVLYAIEPGVKLVFLCSPNNPTGNSIDKDDIIKIVKKVQGLVVVDEAYIDFSSKASLIPEISQYNNLVILQTLSKAWGLAALRMGMLFAAPEIVDLLTRIKPPYNISGPTQELALQALNNLDHMKYMLHEINGQKDLLKSMLKTLGGIQEVYPSDANFLLVKMDNAHAIYAKLIERKIIVRDRSNVELCENSLRITVGTAEENERLVNELRGLIS